MTSHLNEMPRIFETNENTKAVVLLDVDIERRVIDTTIHAPGNFPDRILIDALRQAADQLEQGEIASVINLGEVPDP